jgi:uroporphyrinogen-III decarboxylase
MTALKNDTFLRALLRQPTDHTPTWLMRQAGRYLPEYCATRARAGSFLNLCKSPTLATEVTLQPLARYNLDAAILFSDILTVPDAMGLGLYFAEGEGPKFERPLREEWAIRNLKAPGSPRPSALRHRCRGRNPQGPGRLGAADRFFRQPLHPGLLHGRGRGQRQLHPGQNA